MSGESGDAPARSLLLTLSGREICVHEWGPPESSDVVFFWHGAEYHSGLSISEVASVLATRGVRTIAVDAPGYGRSPAGTDADPRALAQLADDVVTARSASPALFAGHSWGAHVACWAGAGAPRTWRALVLLDGGFFDFADLFARVLGADNEVALAAIHERFADASFDDWPSYFAHLRHGLLRWTDAQEWMYRAAAREGVDGRIRPIVSGATSAAIAAGVVQRPTSQSWAAIAAAGLTVHLLLSTEPPEAATRRQEKFVDAFARALPDADIGRVAGSSHEIVDDAASVVTERLLAALAASASPPAAHHHRPEDV